MSQLEKLLKDFWEGSGDTPGKAAEALGQLGDPKAIPELLKYLELVDAGKSPYMTQQLAGALGDLKAKEAVPRLLALLPRAIGTTAQNILWALGNIGDPVAVEPLIEYLENPHTAGSTAAWALGDIGDKKAVESLLEALTSSDKWTRGSAAYALGMIGDGRAIAPLQNALKDSEEWVREKAEGALVKLGISDVPGLEDWILEEFSKSKDGQRLIELKLVGDDLLKLTGALRILSSQRIKIDPQKEQLILSNPKIDCGACGQMFAIPESEIKLCLRGYLDAPSAYICECQHCKSVYEIRGHTTESLDEGHEYWILTTPRTIASQYANSPYLGWPRLKADRVSIEPI